MLIDTIKRDIDGSLTNGTWRPAKNPAGERIANFSCPKCGDRAGLGIGTNHSIDADGTVHPSVRCDKCDYHEMVKLEDWVP